MPCFRWMAYSLIYTLSLGLPVKADIIKQPDRDPVVLQKDNTPPRGTTKNQVEERFGAPKGIQAAVGNPPISSWDYGNYRVYFEDNFVLHVVVHPSRQSDE